MWYCRMCIKLWWRKRLAGCAEVRQEIRFKYLSSTSIWTLSLDLSRLHEASSLPGELFINFIIYHVLVVWPGGWMTTTRHVTELMNRRRLMQPCEVFGLNPPCIFCQTNSYKLEFSSQKKSVTWSSKTFIVIILVLPVGRLLNAIAGVETTSFG